MIIINSIQLKSFFEKMNLTLEKPQSLDLTLSVFRPIFQEATHFEIRDLLDLFNETVTFSKIWGHHCELAGPNCVKL